MCQVSVYSLVLSHHNKDLEWWTLKPLAGHSSRVLDRLCYSSQCLERTVLSLLGKSVLQFSVAALFYLDNNRKIHPWGVRACWPKDWKRRAPQCVGASGRVRERRRSSVPLFICFFPSLGLPYVNWASQEGCSFFLRSSLWSSDLPLFYFLRLFSSLSFSHRCSGLLFPVLTT